MARKQIEVIVSKQQWTYRGFTECNQVKVVMETNVTEGKIKGPCSWSWFGNELDPFRKVVQEVKDEKKNAVQVKVQRTSYHQI